jgi:hypothetical protein
MDGGELEGDGRDPSGDDSVYDDRTALRDWPPSLSIPVCLIVDGLWPPSVLLGSA